MTETGHNSKEQLRSIIERVENLTDEKQQLADDIGEIYAEAKSNGYDVKALRAIVRRRRADAAKLAEHEAIVETYMHSLGMLAELPLGQAAVKAATAKLSKVSTADPPFLPGDDEMRVAEPEPAAT